MNVIHMLAIIRFISYGMLPESSLPNTPLTTIPAIRPVGAAVRSPFASATIEGTISMVISVALIVFANLLVKRGLNRYRQVRWYLLAMLICAALVAFVLQPMMNSLREEALSHGFPVMLSPLAKSFGQLHGISSVLYLVQSLIGLILLWRLSKPIDLTATEIAAKSN